MGKVRRGGGVVCRGEGVEHLRSNFPCPCLRGTTATRSMLMPASSLTDIEFVVVHFLKHLPTRSLGEEAELVRDRVGLSGGGLYVCTGA